MAQVTAMDAWIPANKAAVAQEISPVVGLPASVLLTTFERATYGDGKITPDILADQQKLADLFYKLHLIPTPITVSDAAWS